MSFVSTVTVRAAVALSLLPLALPAQVLTQAGGANATPAMLRAEYLSNMKEVEQKVMGLAEAFPEAKYSWRPGPGVRSVSEALMHIASELYFYVPGSLGVKPPADLNMGSGQALLTNLEKVSSKAEVVSHLKRAFAYQRTVLEGADAQLAPGHIKAFGQDQSVANFFNAYISDLHEHLGQLIAYARVNSIVPPWSK